LEQKQKGVTLFFSSHELTEVAQLCDRVVLVNGGKVLDERPVDALLKELRRYWVRFRTSGETPFPALRQGDALEAEFTDLQQWRKALDQLTSAQAELLDAGEREGALEDYFVRMVS
jgi:ABC-type multidrug transport system ATPase subunit